MGKKRAKPAPANKRCLPRTYNIRRVCGNCKHISEPHPNYCERYCERNPPTKGRMKPANWFSYWDRHIVDVCGCCIFHERGV